MAGALREPEHHQRGRPLVRDQRWQLAIDRVVARSKHMRDASRAGLHGRLSRQQLDQRAGGIEWRAWKRTEAGDEDRERHYVNPSDLASSSTATAGEVRPAATAATSLGRRARKAGSDLSRAITRSSSIDHIHLTCCSHRRAASAPAALIRSRCSETLPQSSAMPSPVKAENVTTGGVHSSEPALMICSAARYSAAAAVARLTLSTSALLTASMSASSTTPFLIPCSSSPAPGSISTRKKSVMSATAVSDWPVPTVSTSTTS